MIQLITLALPAYNIANDNWNGSDLQAHKSKNDWCYASFEHKMVGVKFSSLPSQSVVEYIGFVSTA